MIGPPYTVQPQSRTRGCVLSTAEDFSSLSAPIVEANWAASPQSAHATIDAADAILVGPPCHALCRLPGHYAHTDLPGGFCYLNNAAIDAQRILDGGLVRVAILDFDVHHGNGAQQIFHARDDVHYVSIHADPAAMYPWFAGYADEPGQDSNLGWNLNLPLPPGTWDAAFFAAVEQGLDAVARKYPAGLVASVGFGTQAGDPTGNLAVGSEGFAAIGRRVAVLGLPTVLIQERGYLIERLGANLTTFPSSLQEQSA